MWAFIIFTVINIADLVLSINGLRCRLLDEGNGAIKCLQALTGINIYASIILAKTGALVLAAWLIFRVAAYLQNEKIKRRLVLKFLSKKSMMEKIVIGTAFICLIIGVVPAIFPSWQWSPMEILYNRIF